MINTFNYFNSGYFNKWRKGHHRCTIWSKTSTTKETCISSTQVILKTLLQIYSDTNMFGKYIVCLSCCHLNDIFVCACKFIFSSHNGRQQFTHNNIVLTANKYANVTAKNDSVHHCLSH